MAVLRSTGEPWYFRRCLHSGRVTMWPYAGPAPRLVGQEPTNPALLVAPNPLNAGVTMLRMPQSYQYWGEGRLLAVVGEVAAGRYDVTVAYHDGPEAPETLLLPPEWVRGGCFALRVRGHSMQEAGIQDGDYVVVRPQPSADNGDLVIAGLTDAEDPAGYVTLKQFFREGGRVRLQPANAAMAPIHLYPQGQNDPVGIQGKVVAVVHLEEDSAWS